MTSFVKILLSITIIFVSLIIKDKISSSKLNTGYPLGIKDELYDYMYDEMEKQSLLLKESNKVIVAFIDTDSCPVTLYNLYEYHQIAKISENLIIFIDSESRETAYNYLEKSDLTYITFIHNESGFFISSQIMNRIFIVDLKNKSGISNIILYPNNVDSIDKKKKLLSYLKSF